ncbi:diaminopimelate decarboxylase [Pilibacter termitis]|uniref:Diaminopimelate decarboxylase n=1 Tax=Pilibacter termitis TaxID=263852 RepID=A0A1T4MQ05_9ENTE|nr:diaminopimelate decarboxylase [Pilibacter termitis]SJZ68951.1 diaminopimelate decarboxylase [Pilibacter termitis]
MNELTIAGVKATELAREYGTPLYVYDQEKIEEKLLEFKENFTSPRFKTKILYASKAFQTIEMIDLVHSFGFCLDVVSGGEFFTALQSQMPVENIYFHGNNKSFAELEFAIENGLQHVIADNLMEVEFLSELAKTQKRNLQVMLRLNVGIDAHTHEYIVTAHIDSKFGMSYESVDCQKAIQLIQESEFLELEGFHAHIGSQIFDLTAWFAEIEKLVHVLKDFDESLTLNLGGGFGVTYTEADKPIPIAENMKAFIEKTEEILEKENVMIRELIIEPGRSVVAEAGITLYTIGYQKKTPNKQYYFVDGGMTDNIRPALYQAEYSCDVVNKLDVEKTETVTIAGKMCESGDIIIQQTKLPKVTTGDILAVYSTGAYGFSMSSHYNRATRPAVIFVKKGESRIVVKRESYEDLLRGEVVYESK